MGIRSAELGDIKDIAVLLLETQELHISAYPEIYKPMTIDDAEGYLENQLTRSEVSIRVADTAGLVVGYCFSEHRVLPETMFAYQRRLTYINQVTVRKDRRRKGIAAQLVEDVVSIAKQREDQRIELDVWGFNEGAKTAFYKVGFEDFGSRMLLKL